MAVTTMTIRNVDEGLITRMRVQAAQYGLSMEDDQFDPTQRLYPRTDSPDQRTATCSLGRQSRLQGVASLMPDRKVIRNAPELDA